jgi:predicted amidohydrolase
MSYSVALGQIKPKLGCVGENLNMIEAVIEKGIQEKASLVLFPELAATGYFLRDLRDVRIFSSFSRRRRDKRLLKNISRRGKNEIRTSRET